VVAVYQRMPAVLTPTATSISTIWPFICQRLSCQRCRPSRRLRHRRFWQCIKGFDAVVIGNFFGRRRLNCSFENLPRECRVGRCMRWAG
jgi:hypothetical protein